MSAKQFSSRKHLINHYQVKSILIHSIDHSPEAYSEQRQTSKTEDFHSITFDHFHSNLIVLKVWFVALVVIWLWWSTMERAEYGVGTQAIVNTDEEWNAVVDDELVCVSFKGMEKQRIKMKKKTDLVAMIIKNIKIKYESSKTKGSVSLLLEFTNCFLIWNVPK